MKALDYTLNYVRNKTSYLIPGTLVAAALGFIGYQTFFNPTLEESLRRVHSAKTESQLVSNVERAISRMSSDGKVSVSFDGKTLRIPTNIDPDLVTILKSDSTILSEYFTQMGPNGEGARKSVEWVVFAPNVLQESSDMYGLSIGDGVILIDTISDDGSQKNPLIRPSVMAHEGSGHEANKSKNYPLLREEKEANLKELVTIEYQRSQNDDPILKGMYNSVKKRVNTAEFLEKFGVDFENVYPKEVILARELLQAKISKGTLSKYAAKEPELLTVSKKPSLGEELKIAAYFAGVVANQSRENAIETLYKFVTDAKYESTMVQVSAASALQHLNPDLMKVESTSDIPTTEERGAFFSFGPPARRSGVGTGVGGSGFGVSDLPSLDDLLKNNEDRPKGTFVTVQIYDGSTVQESRDWRLRKRILIPGKEGKPGPGFYRVQIEAEDTNNNQINDTIFVTYLSDDITFTDGAALVKIDEYRNKQFVGSGVNRMFARSNRKDVELDIEGRWKRWNMEPQ